MMGKENVQYAHDHNVLGCFVRDVWTWLQFGEGLPYELTPVSNVSALGQYRRRGQEYFLIWHEWELTFSTNRNIL